MTKSSFSTTGILGSVALLIAAILGIQFAYGSIARTPTRVGEVVPYTFFSATTTTATSTTDGGGGFVIAGAKKITLQFKRGGITNPNTGSTLFRVQGTIDGGDTWQNVGNFVSSTSTTETFTVNALYGNSVTLTGTSTENIGIDIEKIPYYAIRVIAIETTDGEHTAKALAEF